MHIRSGTSRTGRPTPSCWRNNPACLSRSASGTPDGAGELEEGQKTETSEFRYLSADITSCLLTSLPVCAEEEETGFTCVLCQSVFNGDEILQGLGHFAAGDRQVTRVQEVPDPVVVLEEGLRGSEAELQPELLWIASCAVFKGFK